MSMERVGNKEVSLDKRRTFRDTPLFLWQSVRMEITVPFAQALLSCCAITYVFFLSNNESVSFERR